jgi:ABC-2 type transport system ATP-binding protein
MNSPVLVEGLHKAYSGVPAVAGLDLEIHAGEVFALLGPNGAGKTTTVEVLEGFRRRDGGRVEVLGQDPQSAGLDWRQRLGIVLQSSRGLDLLTVREVLTSTAKVYRHPRGIDEVLEAIGLEEKRDARTASLSGGQRRRLDVGMGIIGRPELLFLDEPTTGFDPRARRDFWALIAGLAGDGTTIVLTTHYLDEAEHLADRVGVIAGGRMLTVDTPAQLGGRHAQEASVSWREDGQVRTVRTTEPTAEVARLASRLGGEVPELEVSRPTLEDTYLRLIEPHATTEQPVIDQTVPAQPVIEKVAP